uniref:ATPase subunit 4 n=1 Tax=Tanacetum cinerariifolium TaxID=118510 RepID=A0A6L2L3Z3_TANCI|nr:ATPase subunit 4 [Tanacetum cinerariifolium]
MMAPPNDEIVPSHCGSRGPSHSPSWKEDSFEIKVLLEELETEGTLARSSGAAHDEAGPSRQDYVVINQSFEPSMRNRILHLEQDDSPYLLGKAKGTYWSNIRLILEHAPSQNKYNRLLEFENKDLQIRSCWYNCSSHVNDSLKFGGSVNGSRLKMSREGRTTRSREKLIQKLLLNQKCMGYLVRAYYSISSRMYYKDDSCWSADLKSKTTEDIIHNRSFMEVLVPNHYVIVRKVL